MAHRLIRRYPRSIYARDDKVKHSFSHLLVLDFECTCKQYEQIEPQEIIEFPCAALSTTTWEVENVFHKYIKPKAHPKLTDFCIGLTGIIQDMVDDQPHFPEVLDNFCEWVEEHNYFKEGNKSVFVTCGNWDLTTALPKHCKFENIPVPSYFKEWINLKDTFCDTTLFYPHTLKDMLGFLNLPLTGKLHSGIDDVMNMVKIIQALRKNYNPEFKVKEVSDLLKQSVKHRK